MTFTYYCLQPSRWNDAQQHLLKPGIRGRVATINNNPLPWLHTTSLPT